jgi:hypothetical protein
MTTPLQRRSKRTSGNDNDLAEKGTMEPPNSIATLASLKVIRNELENLEAIIARLVKLHKELPAGPNQCTGYINLEKCGLRE